MEVVDCSFTHNHSIIIDWGLFDFLYNCQNRNKIMIYARTIFIVSGTIFISLLSIKLIMLLLNGQFLIPIMCLFILTIISGWIYLGYKVKFIP